MSDLQDSSPVSGVTAVRLDGRGGAQPLEPLRALAPDSVPVWIHIDYDDPEAAEWTRKESGLEETIVAAMLDPESRPRCVQYGGGLLTMLRGVNLNPGARLEDMISVRIWLEPGRVVTAARRKLRSLTETRQSLDRGDAPGTPAILVAGLIERLTRHIGDGIEQIEAEIDNAEDNIRLSSGVRSASAFNRLRRQTAQIRRYLSPQREALDRLSRITEPLFKPDETIELREQLNRLTLALEDLELVRERALVAQEEFLGLLAHEQSARMLVLSIVAAVFLPLSFLTGLMGMNVAGLPGTVNPWSFWILVLLMVLAAACILVVFRTRRWL
jgi:zinc transporter